MIDFAIREKVEDSGSSNHCIRDPSAASTAIRQERCSGTVGNNNCSASFTSQPQDMRFTSLKYRAKKPQPQKKHVTKRKISAHLRVSEGTTA
jgi:hypothetical protein